MNKTPTYKANAKQVAFTKNRQSASGKREKMASKQGHAVTLAVHVSRKRGAKSLYSILIHDVRAAITNRTELGLI